ncbi:hypothetical protein E8E13_011560 [Curvularia kusanoi]|uniref:AB hydrolase-1 domain-containing protein n=1 Tax=Curvularia kusanoi TaxID=90978 RepID=A0A9P4WEM2_CURKU|nr:hypothetical protein E8E13_011560 [Curvularia kusanoi]
MYLESDNSHFYTTAVGTKLHYIQLGNAEGPLVICLHGLGGSADAFVPLLPYIPRIYNIVLLDFQGFGKSPLNTSSNTISIGYYVADLDDLIKALQRPSNATQSREIVIVGQSLGAIIALQYAAQHPVEVKGLALIGVGRSAAHIPAVRQRMLDLASSVRAEGIVYAANVAAKSNFYDDVNERTADPKARDAVREAVLRADAEAYARVCEALVDPEHRDPLYGLIKSPAVFIAGDKDMISPLERSKELSALMGGRSWVEMTKSGHQPILEDLAGVKKAIESLLYCVSEG